MSAWALVQLANTDTWTLDGLQIGQALNDPWSGWVGDIFIYSAVKTAAERRSIKLYYDLKFHLWLTDGTTLYFPDPATTGIDWERFNRIPFDWNAVTVSNEYDDTGRSFNVLTDTPASLWEIRYSGLTRDEADVFDAFNDAARRDRTFSFLDKDGTTHTGVRIESYSRDHEGHKSWSSSVAFTLVKYP